MMIHQQAVQNLNADISEAKKKIDDEKGALERENVKLLQIKQHAELEKNADEVEKSKKLLNFNSELTKFATSIQKEIELSKAQADKLANDIKVLVLKTNLNAKPAMSDAAKAISDYESARIEAEADCCSDLNEKKKPFCKAIYKEEKFDKTPQKPELSTGAESTGV